MCSVLGTITSLNVTLLLLLCVSADTRIQRLAECCGKLVKEQDKELRKTYANMFESLSLRRSGPSGGDDDEDVFTADTDHPGIVQPQRKLEKASSLA